LPEKLGVEYGVETRQDAQISTIPRAASTAASPRVRACQTPARRRVVPRMDILPRQDLAEALLFTRARGVRFIYQATRYPSRGSLKNASLFLWH
jgi:hypothetical protein